MTTPFKKPDPSSSKQMNPHAFTSKNMPQASKARACKNMQQACKNMPRACKKKAFNGELWSSPTGWLPSYHCQVCNQIMSKKDETKTPQRINNCGHITCANCIVKSYLVDLNHLCPVTGCGKYVNPKEKNAISSISTILETEYSTLNEDTYYDNYYDYNETDYKDALLYIDMHIYENVNIHYCGDWICPGDCGTLFCGCIDICRGRCGINEPIRFDKW
jgi:hypothetical protein